MVTNTENAVLNIVNSYFEGLHFANVAKLRSIFANDCVLKAPGIRRNLDNWLTLVASREIPDERGDPFDYRVMSVEVMGEQALVKVYCPLLGDIFIDYLGLLYENNQWVIVNKMYASIEEGC